MASIGFVLVGRIRIYFTILLPANDKLQRSPCQIANPMNTRFCAQTPIFCSLFTVAAISLASCSFCCSAGPVGSPLIHRRFTDIDFGQVYIYKGIRRCGMQGIYWQATFQRSGKVASWSFFDDRNTGLSVTPLIFKVTGYDTFTLAGVGATRVSAATGVQTFDFQVIAGTAYVCPGEYTFGFANRAYTLKGTALVAQAPNTGVVAIDRPSATIPNDPWIVTSETSSGGSIALNIGTIIGGNGIPIYNPIDPGGHDRVYSAQATVVTDNPALSPENIAEIYAPTTESKRGFIQAVTGTPIDGLPVAQPELIARSINHSAFGYTLPPEIGLTHRIEASTDLLHWTVVTNAVLHFRDLDSTNFAHRFYRFSEK